MTYLLQYYYRMLDYYMIEMTRRMNDVWFDDYMNDIILFIIWEYGMSSMNIYEYIRWVTIDSERKG